jgi:hypothetical protein
MNCFVHLGFDPVPREVKSPASAIALAEAVLKAERKQKSESRPKVQWRRDEFYPDNFHNYTVKQLEEEIITKGTIVLQLVNTNGELPILGESVTIFTAELEKKYATEAETALEIADEEMEQRQIDLHGESQLKRRIKIKKK